MGIDALLLPLLGVAFVVLMVVLAVWSEERKRRLDMLALQRGLVPPEWLNDTGRGRRRAWLWLCLGLPVLIACALAWGTFRLVEASVHTGRDFTTLLLTMWIVGGAVGLAAVIMGGLGLLADQRHAHRQAPRVDMPRMTDVTGTSQHERKPSSEQIWKQERS
jgi:hypothetical protein